MTPSFLSQEPTPAVLPLCLRTAGVKAGLEHLSFLVALCLHRIHQQCWHQQSDLFHFNIGSPLWRHGITNQCPHKVGSAPINKPVLTERAFWNNHHKPIAIVGGIGQRCTLGGMPLVPPTGLHFVQRGIIGASSVAATSQGGYWNGRRMATKLLWLWLPQGRGWSLHLLGHTWDGHQWKHKGGMTWAMFDGPRQKWLVSSVST